MGKITIVSDCKNIDNNITIIPPIFNITISKTPNDGMEGNVYIMNQSAIHLNNNRVFLEYSVDNGDYNVVGIIKTYNTSQIDSNTPISDDLHRIVTDKSFRIRAKLVTENYGEHYSNILEYNKYRELDIRFNHNLQNKVLESENYCNQQVSENFTGNIIIFNFNELTQQERNKILFKDLSIKLEKKVGSNWETVSINNRIVTNENLNRDLFSVSNNTNITNTTIYRYSFKAGDLEYVTDEFTYELNNVRYNLTINIYGDELPQ